MIRPLYTALFCAFIAIPRPASAMEDLTVVILGTGNPNADPTRSGPSVAVLHKDQAYIVDFGPGVVRRASHAAQTHKEASLEANRLDIAFATHLHSDHTVGLPDLLYTPWVLGRDAPLTLYGPPGIEHLATHVVRAWEHDRRIRLDGLEPANDRGHRIVAHEIQPGVVLERDGLTVEAIAVPHGSWSHAYGYIFRTAKDKVVISGDTAPSQELFRAAKNADLMLHEVYATGRFAERSDVWKAYHSRFHTSTRQLAELAQAFPPKKLVLYHQLYWGDTDADLIEEMRTFGYTGDVVSAADLDRFD